MHSALAVTLCNAEFFFFPAPLVISDQADFELSVKGIRSSGFRTIGKRNQTLTGVMLTDDYSPIFGVLIRPHTHPDFCN
jgi:hypothetical protein